MTPVYSADCRLPPLSISNQLSLSLSLSLSLTLSFLSPKHAPTFTFSFSFPPYFREKRAKCITYLRRVKILLLSLRTRFHVNREEGKIPCLLSSDGKVSSHLNARSWVGSLERQSPTSLLHFHESSVAKAYDREKALYPDNPLNSHVVSRVPHPRLRNPFYSRIHCFKI